MTSNLAELLASGAICRDNKKIDSIEVFILKDATGKCFDHKEAIKADGYKWNAAWKQWGRCTFKAEAGLFDLLKMGVLTASEQDGNVLVVSDGFGCSYSILADSIQFNVTSRRLGSAVLGTNLKEALRQMRATVEAVQEPPHSRL